MFEFYLIGSELAFRRMGHMNWQIQLTKNVGTLPLALDYMLDAERNSTAKDNMADGLTAVCWDRQREMS